MPPTEPPYWLPGWLPGRLPAGDGDGRPCWLRRDVGHGGWERSVPPPSPLGWRSRDAVTAGARWSAGGRSWPGLDEPASDDFGETWPDEVGDRPRLPPPRRPPTTESLREAPALEEPEPSDAIESLEVERLWGWG